jgi:hypothetical protein
MLKCGLSEVEATILSKRLETLKRKVVKLANEPTLSFFDLAQALVELHGANRAALINMPSATGMSRRRMYYLLKVGKLLRDEGITRGIAETVGWMKLQIVARYWYTTDKPSPRPVTELLQLASKHKTRDLPAAINGKKVMRRRVVHFYLSTGARAELNEALIRYGAQQKRKRLTGKEAALIRIVRAVIDIGPSED